MERDKLLGQSWDQLGPSREGKGAGVVITGDLHAGHKTSYKTQLLGEDELGTEVDELIHRTELKALGRCVCMV